MAYQEPFYNENLAYSGQVGPFRQTTNRSVSHYLFKLITALALSIVLCAVEFTFVDSMLYYRNVKTTFNTVSAEITEGELYRSDTDTDTSGVGEAKYSYSYTYEQKGESITRQGNFTAPYNKGDNIIIYIDPKDSDNIELPQSEQLDIYYIVMIAVMPVIWLISVKNIFSNPK